MREDEETTRGGVAAEDRGKAARTAESVAECRKRRAWWKCWRKGFREEGGGF